MVKAVHVVRTGREIEDLHGNRWQPIVFADCNAIVVEMVGPRRVCIRAFEIPPIDNAGDKVALRVGALRDACVIAKHLETCPDWELAFHV